MKITVESIEGKTVRFENEDGTFSALPKREFPSGIRAGDILENDGGGWKILKEETQERRKKMLALQASLFKKKGGSENTP